MSLIIDGYNLAYEVGWLTRRQRGPKALESARTRLLNFIVHSLPADELAKTTVVFDAKQLPEGVAAVQEFGGIHVLFAEKYEDADALIEELIRTAGTPKTMTVVSSDQRILTAAKRRKATPLPSEEWYDQVVRNRSNKRPEVLSDEEVAKRGNTAIPSEERDYWLRKFS